MGREIRRVPPDWEHPRWTEDDAPYNSLRSVVGEYRTLFDESYSEAVRRWVAGFQAFLINHPSGVDANGCSYWEGESPPDKNHYRDREWNEEEATHYQVYETVSEGTPVTPHFATKDELVDYLVEHGDFWDQRRGDGGWTLANAKDFVEREYACSLVIKGGEFLSPRDGQFIS